MVKSFLNSNFRWFAIQFIQFISSTVFFCSVLCMCDWFDVWACVCACIYALWGIFHSSDACIRLNWDFSATKSINKDNLKLKRAPYARACYDLCIILDRPSTVLYYGLLYSTTNTSTISILLLNCCTSSHRFELLVGRCLFSFSHIRNYFFLKNNNLNGNSLVLICVCSIWRSKAFNASLIA